MRHLVLAIVMALGAPLSAMVVRPLTFDQLVGESTAIVYGRVADVRGQWTADRQGIDSLLSVESIEYFKGALGETVTVRVPGGQVGTLVHVLPGAPRFTVGDVVVLFLKVNGPAIPIVTGTTQGVFRVKVDPRTGDRLVMPPAVHMAETTSRGDPARRPMPIQAFGSAIRGVAGRAEMQHGLRDTENAPSLTETQRETGAFPLSPCLRGQRASAPRSPSGSCHGLPEAAR